VQAWVPRQRIGGLMSGSGVRSIGWATGLGAASSSCSYAAIAIAKSLFQKGASAASALAFQFASTNLVWELGLVLWVLIGWQFTLAEYLGGIVMIVLMTVLLRVFVSRRLEEEAREHAVQADTGHQHHMAGEQLTWRERLTSLQAWSDVAHNFRGDWQMLWKEITLGFLLAGFIAQLGNGFFEHLFIRNAPAPLPTIENVLIGPIIAVISFVCSVGNVPLAAVVWSGGISFAGVLAFLYADLIAIPILLIYRKYYGGKFTLRITALMFVTHVLVAGATGRLGLLVNVLRARGHTVRAMTRDPGSGAASRLRRAGAQIVFGEFDDPASIEQAAAGVDVVFATGTAHRAGLEGELRHGRNLTMAAAAASVPHVVFCSGDGAAPDSPVPLFRVKHQVEERIRAIPAAYTILAPAYFMENLFNPWNVTAFRAGVFPSPIAVEAAFQQVAIADVAALAAIAIERPDEFAGERIAIASDQLTGLRSQRARLSTLCPREHMVVT
jgi:uncharacterized protein YbjT (DUF2867 family)/uncharacterized membrane protein YraQ (UPF0718 family)